MASKIFKELKRRNVYKVGTVYAITAWLIIQVLSIATNSFNAPGWVMKTLIIVLVAGFPIALILAWAFELTPDGFRRTSDISNEKESSRKKTLYLNSWIIALLILALVILGIERIFFAESPIFNDKDEKQKASIAVLPFADFSPKGDQGYFAYGISEELLNSLAKVKDLRVAGRTSSFQFQDQNRDIKMIGDSLGVGHVLEGSVRKAGNHIRITAQLVRTDNGFHVWSQSYDRPYSAQEIFEIQDDISAEVLEQLKIHLLPSDIKNKETKRTKNTVAYDLYLKGTVLEATFNPTDIEKAIEYYNRAIEIDPEFALAYARKASALLWLNYFGNLPFKEMMEESRKAADWALLLDHNLGEAYAAIGLIKWRQNKLKQSLAAFDLAKSLNPGDPEIRAAKAMPLLLTERWDEAYQELSYAYKLDPLSLLVNLNFGWHYYYRGEYEKAKKHFKKALKVNPNVLEAYDGLATVSLVQGHLGEAFVSAYSGVNAIEIKSPLILYTLTDLARELRLKEIAGKNLEILDKEYPNNVFSFHGKVDQLLLEEKYQEIITYTDNYYDKTEGIDLEEYTEIKAKAQLALGNYSEALEVIKAKYPVALKTDTVHFGHRNFAIIQYAALALQKTGNEDKASKLAKNVCDHFSAINEDSLKSLDKSSELYVAACAGLLGNKEAVKQFLENRIKNRNINQHNYVYGLFNELFLNLSEKEIEPYRKKEELILREQREEVISYLKENNAWKREWK